MQRMFVPLATLLLGSTAGAAPHQDDKPQLSRHSKGYTFAKKVTSIPDDALPLLLRIEVPQNNVLAGENFPIRFTITNPNRMTLRLSTGGESRPSLYAGLTDEELTLFVEQSIELQIGNRVIVLAPGEAAAMTHTVYPDSGAVSAMLYDEHGYTLRIRGAGTVKTVAVEEPECAEVLCKWESEEIQVPVRAPTRHERKAYQTIFDWNESQVQRYGAIVERNRARGVADLVSGEEWTLAKIDFRRKFLNEYGDTPYATQVRVQLLRNLEHLPRQKSGNNEKPQRPFFPLYVKTVSELLDSGVPYASKVDRGVLETLAMAGRWDLVVDALDKLLAINPLERTLDQTFTRFSHEFVDFPRLQAKGYISEGKETEDLEAVAVRCIERCAGWKGYRATPFDRRTFTFLTTGERWDLLELAAQRTIDVSSIGRDCGTGGRSSPSEVSDETIAAARNAVMLAQEKKATP